MNAQRTWFSLNTRLGIVAGLLGFLALIAGSSNSSRGVTLDPKKLASLIQNELDHVSAMELAGWIMEQKTDFALIDLRDPKSFNEYHIPEARNLSLTELVETHFDRRQTIVLYSDGGVHSAQAMFLLWAEGYHKAVMLKGGLNEWKDDVLHPSLHLLRGSAFSSDSLEAVKRRAAFFGGSIAIPPTRPFPQQKPVQEREKLRDEC